METVGIFEIRSEIIDRNGMMKISCVADGKPICIAYLERGTKYEIQELLKNDFLLANGTVIHGIPEITNLSMRE